MNPAQVSMPPVTLYKTTKNLQDMDFVDIEDGIKLTDAGRMKGL